jgi:hypothetical protein
MRRRRGHERLLAGYRSGTGTVSLPILSSFRR